MKLTELRFDRERFSQAFKEAIARQVRQGMRDFLRATMFRVPVYTGMARASLRPLGAFLRVAIPIAPIAVRKGYSIAEGERQGAFAVRSDKWTYSITLSISVLHYFMNEFFHSDLPLTHPTPWGSTTEGEAAFRRYMQANLRKRLPLIKDFIVEKKVTVG